ncbi:MAG TPA: extracellular solute-binding protein [Atribacteraceae bacterium]|nr:extracellular solute-binding protein [Atribacteraceae bacterium]
MKNRVWAIVLVAVVVASVALGTGRAEAATPTRSLNILMFSSFVAENDQMLRTMAEEFGRMKGIDVTVNFVGIAELHPKLAAEAVSRSGHDIIGMENLQVSLYEDSLLPITDVVNQIVERYGQFAPAATTAAVRDGEWMALPWWIVPFHQTYREDLFKNAGLTVPNTWQEVLESGRELKARGNPIGIPFGNAGDANNSLYSILWSFGAGIADQNGVITLDSQATRDAIAFTQTLFQEAMVPDVLGWASNAANNHFILSGVGSWTLNPISIWVLAGRESLDLTQHLNHHGALAGPAGRFGSGDFYSLGIWEFSPNIDLAKEFLLYLYDEQQMNRYLTSGQGFNLPTHPHFYNHSVFEHPKLQGLRGFADYFRLTGYPAPPDMRAQEAYVRWVVPNMFLRILGGHASVDQAISEAVAELVEIGYTLPQ